MPQVKNWRHSPPGTVIELGDGRIVCADAIEFLKALKEECADIVFLDPPFNLSKRYGKKSASEDCKDEQTYREFMQVVLQESARIVCKGGALYLYHIPKWAITLGASLQTELQFRHWIAISMKNGFVRGERLYPAHYALLYFTKGNPKTFNRPKIPVQLCRSCGETVRDYGGYRSFVKEGVNLSDIWDDISPVRHKSTKTRSANELPITILDRVMSVSGKHGALLVDPFAGSGVSLVSARSHGMRFMACDREKSYCQIMLKRLGKLSKVH